MRSKKNRKSKSKSRSRSLRKIRGGGKCGSHAPTQQKKLRGGGRGCGMKEPRKLKRSKRNSKKIRRKYKGGGRNHNHGKERFVVLEDNELKA